MVSRGLSGREHSLVETGVIKRPVGRQPNSGKKKVAKLTKLPREVKSQQPAAATPAPARKGAGRGPVTASNPLRASDADPQGRVEASPAWVCDKCQEECTPEFDGLPR